MNCWAPDSVARGVTPGSTPSQKAGGFLVSQCHWKPICCLSTLQRIFLVLFDWPYLLPYVCWLAMTARVSQVEEPAVEANCSSSLYWVTVFFFIFLYTWHQVDWRFGTCTRIYQEFKLCCDWHLTWLGGRDSHRRAIPDVACSWELSRLSDQEMASENGLPSKGPRD